MTNHAQTGTVPLPPACPGAGQARKKLPAARRALRLAALAMPFPLLLASAAAASAAPGPPLPDASRGVPAQAAVKNSDAAWYRVRGPVTSVSARFTIPKLTCPARGTLGIQPGVELFNDVGIYAMATVVVLCRKGNPVYRARTVLYDTGDRLPITIKTGDTMAVSLTATATASSASIADLTQRASVTVQVKTAARHLSAFVGDDYFTNDAGLLLGVPPFGTITFTAAKADGHALAASHPTAVNRIIFGVLQIRTGPLNSAGTSFTTTFKHV